MKIFAIYDKKAQSFVFPHFTPNSVTAVRGFERSCKDVNSDLHNFPSEFALYDLGNFDETVGKIQPLEIPTLVHEATEFVD